MPLAKIEILVNIQAADLGDALDEIVAVAEASVFDFGEVVASSAEYVDSGRAMDGEVSLPDGGGTDAMDGVEVDSAVDGNPPVLAHRAVGFMSNKMGYANVVQMRKSRVAESVEVKEGVL